MGIFTNIAQELIENESESREIIENVTSLSDDEINRIADHVIDGMKEGHGDVTELAHQALENVAGMETADESILNKAITKIKNAVTTKSKNTKPANKNSKDFKDLMSG